MSFEGLPPSGKAPAPCSVADIAEILLDLSKKLDVSFERFYRGTNVGADCLAKEGSQLSDFFCSAGDSFWSLVGHFVSIFFSYTVEVLCL